MEKISRLNKCHFAIKYVKNHPIFSGSLENLTMLPVSPEQALTNLDLFAVINLNYLVNTKMQ